MEKGINTFKNKPILGYFGNNDFESHNGEYKNDPETGLDYWDTSGVKGERILGFIRSDDEVKIVEDENGLSWICLTCVLWVQYNFKQVKRLLKDAKRAKENGGPTKNISVEVDITDYEVLPNKVIKINDFNLVGITILGSRNGIKVEPGIEGAELSVMDVTGNEFFAKQQQALRLAYEKLDGKASEETKKEGYSQVNEVENKEQLNAESTLEAEAEKTNFEAEPAVCPECGQEPCTCAKAEDKPEDCAKDDCKMEEDKSTEDGDAKTEDECKMSKGDSENDDDDEDDEDDAEDKEKNCKMSSEEQPQEATPAEENSEPEKFNLQGDATVIYDLSYVLRSYTDMVSGLESSVNYYSNYIDEDFVAKKDTVIAFLSRMRNCAAECVQETTSMIADLASGLTDEKKMYEKEISQYTLKSLFEQFKDVVAERDGLKAEFSKIERQEFLNQAQEIINSVSDLEEEKGKEFYSKCENGEINSIDDLKSKVAIEVTFSKKKDPQPKVVESYSAPINEPAVDSFMKKEEKKVKKNQWEALNDYIKN